MKHDMETKKPAGNGTVDWSFFRDDHGNWRWRRTRHGLLESSAPFVQYWDCVQDAKGKGYSGQAEDAAQSG